MHLQIFSCWHNCDFINFVKDIVERFMLTTSHGFVLMTIYITILLVYSLHPVVVQCVYYKWVHCNYCHNRNVLTYNKYIVYYILLRLLSFKSRFSTTCYSCVKIKPINTHKVTFEQIICENMAVTTVSWRLSILGFFKIYYTVD